VAAIVRLVFWNCAFPVGTALFLIHVRARYGIGIYAIAASLLLAFALAYRALRASVVYCNRGTLSAVGFYSWALLGALASIVVLCSARRSTKQKRTALVLASFLVTNIWIFCGSWIS